VAKYRALVIFDHAGKPVRKDKVLGKSPKSSATITSASHTISNGSANPYGSIK